MNVTIGRITAAAELSTIRAMFQEYANSMGLDLTYQSFSEELANLPGKYAPPSGCILIARVGGEPAGCVALRPLGDGVCEMKRLYVQPRHRGLSLGRKLAERIIEEARDLGYGRIRLDTIASRMGDAVALYRALGFRDVPPYCDSPFPDAIFMELHLD
jgi:putative acetyltransferase